MEKKPLYRVESKREGHNWRMDDDNFPGEMSTRWLDRVTAAMHYITLSDKYPTMEFRVVKED